MRGIWEEKVAVRWVGETKWGNGAGAFGEPEGGLGGEASRHGDWAGALGNGGGGIAQRGRWETVNIVTYDRINISGQDFARLEHNGWLNDVMLDFGLALWVREMRPEVAREVSVLNPYIFRGFVDSGYDMISRLVKKKGGDLFFKKFTLIPVNVDNMHWLLAIVHPVGGKWAEVGGGAGASGYTTPEDEDDEMASLFGAIVEDEGDVDNGGEMHRAHVYILDSLCEQLGFQLSNTHQDVVTHIEELLNRVARERRRGWGLIEAIGKAVRVPRQVGGNDCGVWVLHLARVFLRNPAKFCYLMTADGRGTSAEDAGRDWQAEEFTNLRGILLERIEDMVAAREREEAGRA
ncbi:hypothetical protein DFH07DRAFT_966245 [Mycena maculata]|uniref:Ubiquitin-like protease family profile domain-containing protein n=1 Tax=Mycena maculata TaxID=230809 RepID=A0AAD7IA05_9AGAR|nr:hypothetical protein DFH07DRAFT_966245 [Mycena maculata]